jgi:iron complex outermembrane receptor protein
MRLRTTLLASIALAALTIPAMAQTEQVVVYGTLPGGDIGLSRNKIPGALQSLSADEVGAARGPTVLEALGTRIGGATLFDVQGNSMFQNLRYHGFEASPLQGVSQGVAVYQNGMRLNEVFGDTVNWEAVPQTAIDRLDMWSNNPVFGLNALGGAVNMVMKNGFTWQGQQASIQGGSFGHVMGTLQYGMHDGNFSVYAAAEGVRDGGWRLQSESQLGRLYFDAGWRFGDSELHVVASGAQSGLGVIGPTPIEAVQRYSKSIFTWPQTTQNRVASLALNGKTKLADHWQVQASAYVRNFRQRHDDGNDSEFERCSNSSSFVGRLCLEDDGFTRPQPFTGQRALNFRNQFAMLDQAGNSIAFTPGAIYGTIDRTFTDATSQGVTVQATSDDTLFGLSNYFTFGGSIDHGALGFRSTSTLGRIFPDLGVRVDSTLPGSGSILRTNGNLGYAPVTLRGATDYYGLYVVDALDLTDTLTLTAGFRANAAIIETNDRSGVAPELTGKHGFGHVNPMAGLTWQMAEDISLFGGYSQSNRAPTPLELNCADPLRPCLLEGALVADPPLAQIVAHTYEAGLRGGLAAAGGTLSWSASLFRTEADNDIVALASTIQGRGYFTNVPSTLREGVDLTGQFKAEGWSTYASYSFLNATYGFNGTLASPNNPMANGAGNVMVTAGRTIPMNPAHQFHVGGDGQIFSGLTVGGDVVFTGSRWYDGDHANQNRKLPSLWTVNIRAAYDITEQWQVFGLVNNLFDTHAASFGTYFDPEDTEDLYTPELQDPRSITRIQPISFQVGLRLSL